ncbi:MAG: transporter [Paenibacillaceae bacterium]|jgi:subfamily B ATP-binding cassette protein MsbA|nr:transporter [Paenibacillaceae bacterium]
MRDSDPRNNKPKTSIAKLYKKLLGHAWVHKKYLLVAALAIVTVTSLQFIVPQLTRYTIDEVIPGGIYSPLIWVALGVLGSALILGVCNFLSTFMMSNVGQRTIYDIRNQLYRHIQSLDMSFFDRNRTGDLMSRVTNDVNTLQQLITSGMVQIVTDVFTFLAIAIYMLYADWELALLLMVTFPLMAWQTRVFGTKIRSQYKTVQESIAGVTDHLQDTLSSIKLIKSYSNEQYETDRFSVRNEKNRDANINAVKLYSTYTPVIDFLNYLGMAIVVVFGAFQAMRGRISIGEIAAFISYLRLLQNPIRHFSRIINTVSQAAAASERIFEILDTKPDVTDKEGAVALPPIRGHIVFDHVKFGYTEEMPVLRDFNLEIPVGQTVALVGSSGAGKSTIAHLIPRFYDPQDGKITVDGYDVRDVTMESLRNQMGIVTQDIVLLNGTIRDNIAYGKPGATDAEIEEAAKAANAHDFITSFPLGYDSPVGERGVKLSGGQKQRLSIARALLKSPQLVILDEATSALDTESEHLIQGALARLLVGRSCLVIAHRISTIQRANKIVVMEKGQCIESGTHDELIAHAGRYKQLYDLQFPQAKPVRESEEGARGGRGERGQRGERSSMRSQVGAIS